MSEQREVDRIRLESLEMSASYAKDRWVKDEESFKGFLLEGQEPEEASVPGMPEKSMSRGNHVTGNTRNGKHIADWVATQKRAPGQ